MKTIFVFGMMVLTSVAFATGTQQVSGVALEVLQESRVIQGFHAMNGAARATAIRQLLQTANPAQLASMAREVQKRMGGNTKVTRESLKTMLLQSATELEAPAASSQGTLTDVAKTVTVQYQGPAPLTTEIKGVPANRETDFYTANSETFTYSGVEMVDQSTEVETCLRKFNPKAADNVVKMAEKTRDNVKALAGAGTFEGLPREQRAVVVANKAYYPAFLDVTEREDGVEAMGSLKKFASSVEVGGCGGASEVVAQALR